MGLLVLRLITLQLVFSLSFILSLSLVLISVYTLNVLISPLPFGHLIQLADSSEQLSFFLFSRAVHYNVSLENSLLLKFSICRFIFVYFRWFILFAISLWNVLYSSFSSNANFVSIVLQIFKYFLAPFNSLNIKSLL